MSILSKHKFRITDDKFAEKIRLALRAIKTVRHIRLIAEIDKILRCQIRTSIRTALTGGIVELIHREKLLEHSKTACSRIEHSDRTLQRKCYSKRHCSNRT